MALVVGHGELGGVEALASMRQLYSHSFTRRQSPRIDDRSVLRGQYLLTTNITEEHRTRVPAVDLDEEPKGGQRKL